MNNGGGRYIKHIVFCATAAIMIRVRLKFDSSPVDYARKCWFVFDSEKCRLVGDVSHLIASHFKLKSSRGIQVRPICL